MSRFQRLFLWWSTLVTAVTGVAYAWMKYLMEPADPWAVVNHPLEPWMLKLHILAAPLMLFAVGLIATEHIWRHWKSGLPTGRRTGLATALAFFPLALTGYLIQAVTLPWLLSVVTWSHLGLGLVCVVGLVLHRVVLRRRRAKRAGGLPVVRLDSSPPEEAGSRGPAAARTRRRPQDARTAPR